MGQAPSSGTLLSQVAIPESGDSRRTAFLRALRWSIVLLLALLLHFALLESAPWDWLHSATPPRVDVQTVDPAKLAAIRKQWEKSLLLDKTSRAAKDAAPDARYMSDRNIHVDKEQRAKETAVVPKPGRPGEAAEAPQEKLQEKPEAKAQAKPALRNLGVPIKLTSRPPAKPQPPLLREHVAGERAGENGGSQYIDDNRVPVGSENMLNAQESVYYSFYSRLYDAIAPVWEKHIRSVPNRRRVAQGEYRTVVDVVLDADGNLLSVQRIQNSGIPEFDAAVDASWKSIGRYPNPPRELLNERGEIHTAWTFAVLVGPGFNLQYAPPERSE